MDLEFAKTHKFSIRYFLIFPNSRRCCLTAIFLQDHVQTITLNAVLKCKTLCQLLELILVLILE